MLTKSTFDINTDFSLDTRGYWTNFWRDEVLGGGKDPDNGSPTLKKYHQFLWSKPLPCGEMMQLEAGPGILYLKWGDFYLGSDSILSSFRYQRNRALLTEVKESMPNYHEFLENFLHRAYTIGGLIIFPQMSGSINQSRGCNKRICDRWDLTLECIRRFYASEQSPLSACLEKNRSFFKLFVDFKGYVDFFFFQDCVSEDYTQVHLWNNTELFVTDPIPHDVQTYLSYINQQLDFLEKRNARIQAYVDSL